MKLITALIAGACCVGTGALAEDTSWQSGAPAVPHPLAIPAPPTPSPMRLAQTGPTPEASPKPEPQSGPDAAPPKPGDAPKPASYRDGAYILEKDYYLSYPRNVWRLLSAPADFDAKDWWITAGLIGATGIFFIVDKEIRDFWQGDIRSGTSEDIFNVFNVFGDVKYMGALALGTYAIAEAVDQAGLADAKREKAFGLMALESIAIAQGFSFSMKWLFGRDRPNKTDDRWDFRGPGNGDNQAFPSGHATVAFALATTISKVYGDRNRWVPWTVYPIAVGTALARIDKNKHWASDVFLGGLVGYFVADTVVKHNPFMRKHNLSLRPMQSVDGPGLALVHRF